MDSPNTGLRSIVDSILKPGLRDAASGVLRSLAPFHVIVVGSVAAACYTRPTDTTNINLMTLEPAMIGQLPGCSMQASGIWMHNESGMQVTVNSAAQLGITGALLEKVKETKNLDENGFYLASVEALIVMYLMRYTAPDRVRIAQLLYSQKRTFFREWPLTEAESDRLNDVRAAMREHGTP